MKNEINDKVEKTLAAFDNMERAEVPPFFYTRLQGRLASDSKSMAIQRNFAWATLVIIVILNSMFYAFYEPEQEINSEEVIVQMYDEYNIDQFDLLDEIEK